MLIRIKTNSVAHAANLKAMKSMSLRETLLSHRIVPTWVLAFALIGLGLYFGWESIRPDERGLIYSGDLEAVLSASEDSLEQAKDYMDHIDRLHQAIKAGDQEVIERMVKEQVALNHSMEERLTATRATEDKRSAERAAAVRQARITLGISGALLLSLGAWIIVTWRSENSEPTE